MPKKMIGMTATAAPAMSVVIFSNQATMGSAASNDRANDPTKSRTPIAEASAMRNPIILLRRRWDIWELSWELAAVVGMKFSGDMRVGESPSPDVGWLHSGGGGEAPKQSGAAFRSATLVDEVERPVLG